MARTRSSMRRARRKGTDYVPRTGDYVIVKDKRTDKELEALVLEYRRNEGIHGATIRFQDKDLQRLPSGGLAWFPAREMEPTGRKLSGAIARSADERGVADQEPTEPPKKKPPKVPTFVVVNTVNTALNHHYDFGVHVAGCADVRKATKRYGVDVYQHFESTPEEVVQAEINDLASGGIEDAADFNFKIFACCKPAPARAKQVKAKPRQAKGADLQGDQEGLQSLPVPATVRSHRAGKPARQTSTTRRTNMARRTAAATKEPEPAPTRRRGRAKAAPEPEPENGGSTRMTHEDKLKLVPGIVKRLKAGESFADIRRDPNMPSSGLRKALYDSGYNTRGEKVEEDEDLTELEGKKLAAAVAKMRREGVPWFRIELAADAGQAELKDLLEDHGFGDLADGRVARAKDEAEEEPAPAKRASRKRGAAKAAEETPKASAGRRRGGRRRANPSEED